MQFNSIDFMIFFPIVLIVYFIIQKKLRLYWLLIASYYSYMSWNMKYIILIFLSTLITYISALILSNLSNDKSEKTKKILVLVICLVINLGILAVFKYGNFTLETVDFIFSSMGIKKLNIKLDLLLPVGISFYTFQALGYMIDVYRGDVKAEKNFFRYALFVSFFPQLVAGPIERSKNLLSQMNNIEKIKLWDANRITRGAILIIYGLFMKMVIADRVAILVDTVFNSYYMYGSTELILAAIGFAIQIYCDFGSYSLIAIGSARIMGFNLMENFNAPYFANSIRDFWSRWHISLSTWFRDYLYIPLGGNRKGKIRKNINMLIVFVVSGLWHGANWSFVVWGMIHGLYQIIADVSKSIRKRIIGIMKIKTECFSWNLLNIIITFILISIAWIFFRADNIADAINYIGRIINKPTPWVLFDGSIFNLGLNSTEFNILLISVIILLLIDLISEKKKMLIDEFLLSQNIWFEWAVIIIFILMIFIFGEYGPDFDAKKFIYFQF